MGWWEQQRRVESDRATPFSGCSLRVLLQRTLSESEQKRTAQSVVVDPLPETDVPRIHLYYHPVIMIRGEC